MDDASVSGALNETKLVLPLSFKTSLLEIVPLPWTVTFPETVAAPEVMVPVVLISVEPPIVEFPFIVAVVIVLLVKFSVASRVTTTPELGKVAVELTPVPPFAVGSTPLTAALCARFTAPNPNAPPAPEVNT